MYDDSGVSGGGLPASQHGSREFGAGGYTGGGSAHATPCPVIVVEVGASPLRVIEDVVPTALI
jgi:hypothetical protein